MIMTTTSSQRIRRGFTIIETLVVASVTSILMSLLVPGMQQARNSAKEVECRNRLKQIGLALHNYHDVFNCFAPGWISRRAEGEGHPSTVWQAFLLPYVEEAQLYNMLDLRNPIYETQFRGESLLKKPLVHFRCPMDSLGDTNPLRGGWGTSNYTGNFGAAPIPRWSESENWPGQIPTPKHFERKSAQYNGLFFVNSNVRIRDIYDGTSNTIMVGEKCVVGRSGIWPGPRSNFHESDVVSDGSYASPLNRTDTGYSSRHTGGMLMFLLCDGSARAVHESLDSQKEMGMLQKLSGRNDGQVIGEF